MIGSTARAWAASLARARSKLLDRPEHRHIAGALVVIIGLAGVAKLVSAAKEIAVAAHYGTGPVVDAYVLLFNLLFWPLGVWIGIGAAVLVPLLVRGEINDPKDAILFRRELWGLTLWAGPALSVAIAVILWWVAREHWLGAAPVVDAQTAAQAAPLSLMLPFALAANLFAAFMIADRRHSNNVLEAIPAIAIIAALVSVRSFGYEPLVWATVVGTAAQLAAAMALQHPDRRAYRPAFSFASRLWKALIASAGIVALATALAGATAIVDQVAAAGVGTGGNATLGYATRLTGLIVTLASISVSRAILPVLARLGAQDPVRQGQVARQWSLLMGGVGLLAVIIGWVVAPTLVRLMFQRGAFKAEDALLVTRVFRYSLLQLPFFLSGMVLIQQIASNGMYSAFLKIGTVNLVAKLVGVAVLAPLLGVAGIALSTAFMYAVGRIQIEFLSRHPRNASFPRD